MQQKRCDGRPAPVPRCASKICAFEFGEENVLFGGVYCGVENVISECGRCELLWHTLTMINYLSLLLKICIFGLRFILCIVKIKFPLC